MTQEFFAGGLRVTTYQGIYQISQNSKFFYVGMYGPHGVYSWDGEYKTIQQALTAIKAYEKRRSED